LDPEDKKSQNLEGELLSVCHPHHIGDWRRIARLGDASVHLAEGPFELVDVLECDAPVNWAKGKGYLKTAEVHEVVTYREDRNDGLLRFMKREKANKTFHRRLAEGRGVTIQTAERLIGTEKLYEKRSRISAPQAFPIDAIWVQYAFSKNLDGLWWQDTHNPNRLSCPHGGLHPKHISKFKQVNKSELR
jgi:hypothetical protein